jgi:hypothetical protein
MNQNLDLLRQTYCRPATVTGKTTHYLFPLEKECEEGKRFLAKAPAPLLELQEFDPSGLEQTYHDEITGAELPVFAVFNLEGNHQSSFEITTEFVPTTADPASLQARIPFKKSQAFVRKLNQHRAKAERVLAILASILGLGPATAYVFSRTSGTAGVAVLFIFFSGWVLAAVVAYLSGLYLLDRFCPWKKMVITAEFNGILPKEAREKAHQAIEHFNNLYLVVDQQHRWKSEILPDPAPRTLDPLLIGELKQGDGCKFFVIHQFDLTEAEEYLGAEFAIKLG